MKILNGFLYDNAGKQVSYKPTPNHGGTLANPEYLIMHFTADTNPGSTIGWFLNREAAASAHLLIDRSGNITQFAPFNVVCWHAGASAWNGINGLNSHSIGIELTNAGRLSKSGDTYRCGTDNAVIPNDQVIRAAHKNDKGAEAYWQTYTPAQIAVAAQVADTIVRAYNLKDILGHDDIAPIRKSDPGPAFNMADFKKEAGFDALINKTVTATLNLRSGPGVGNSVITTLPKGTSVNLLSSVNGWANIYVPSNGLTGFVNLSYLN